MSSMAPAIVVEDGEAKLAIGAAGGPEIISAVSFVLFNYFYLNRSLGQSIVERRLHHQYLPDRILYDKGFDEVSSTAFHRPNTRKQWSMDTARFSERSPLLTNLVGQVRTTENTLE